VLVAKFYGISKKKIDVLNKISNIYICVIPRDEIKLSSIVGHMEILVSCSSLFILKMLGFAEKVTIYLK